MARAPRAACRVHVDAVADPLAPVALGLDGSPSTIDRRRPCRLTAPERPGVRQTTWLGRIEVARCLGPQASSVRMMPGVSGPASIVVAIRHVLGTTLPDAVSIVVFLTGGVPGRDVVVAPVVTLVATLPVPRHAAWRHARLVGDWWSRSRSPRRPLRRWVGSDPSATTLGYPTARAACCG